MKMEKKKDVKEIYDYLNLWIDEFQFITSQ